MPGGLMQLVAYGAMDLYLTGNPQITYFKLVYRRHTNFATEYIEQPFEKLPNFSTTQESIVTCNVDRNADLLHDCYLIYDLPAIYGCPLSKFRWVPYLGHNIIEKVSILIAGNLVDEQYGQWLNIWSELTLSDEKKRRYYNMIGHNYSIHTAPNLNPVNNLDNEADDNDIDLNVSLCAGQDNTLLYPSKRLYIPLMFWFCTNPGLAIPLISLQYMEVFIQVEFNPLNKLFLLGSKGADSSDYDSCLGYNPLNYFLEGQKGSLKNETDKQFYEYMNGLNITYRNIFYYFISPGNDNLNLNNWKQNSYILANYIYLGNDERKMFANNSQDYLITKVQRNKFTGLKDGPNTIELNLMHPVKELIWVLQKNVQNGNNYNNNYTLYDNIPRYNNYIDYISNHLLFNNTRNNNGLNQSIANISNNVQKYNNYYNETVTSRNPYLFDKYGDIMLSSYLKFNGHDRFSERGSGFFSDLQIYKYHTGSPNVDGIYVYSFAEKPEDHQPSGTCNMSRIEKVEMFLRLKNYLDIEDLTAIQDNPSLALSFSDYNMYLYAPTYNVLRFMSGMASLVFSN
jgi:hypothetical protein